jgi:hypothetical protein
LIFGISATQGPHRVVQKSTLIVGQHRYEGHTAVSAIVIVVDQGGSLTRVAVPVSFVGATKTPPSPKIKTAKVNARSIATPSATPPVTHTVNHRHPALRQRFRVRSRTFARAGPRD